MMTSLKRWSWFHAHQTAFCIFPLIFDAPIVINLKLKNVFTNIWLYVQLHNISSVNSIIYYHDSLWIYQQKFSRIMIFFGFTAQKLDQLFLQSIINIPPTPSIAGKGGGYAPPPPLLMTPGYTVDLYKILLLCTTVIS